MVFHWSLNDSKSSHTSRTLLSILADVNNAVVCMVYTYPLISKFSSPFIKLLVTFPNAPIGVIIIFMFNSICSLASSWYLSLFLLSFIFTLWFARIAMSIINLAQMTRHSDHQPKKGNLGQVFFFWLMITMSGHLGEIRWSVYISKS